MLRIYGAEDGWTADEPTECLLESMSTSDELDSQGKWIDASPLHSVTTATSLRMRHGKRHITDGPFAETTEQLGGCCIFDVDSRAEAIEVASRMQPAWATPLRVYFRLTRGREARLVQAVTAWPFGHGLNERVFRGKNS